MIRQHRLRSIFPVLVATLAGFGTALAQDGSAGPNGGENATGTIQERAALSGEEQISEAARVRRQAEGIRNRTMQMLDTARQERDIIRVTCLNDKLTQLNANLGTLDRRAESLSAAADRQDDTARNHEYTVVVVLDQKFQVLEQEANQCIGQDMFETGSTRVVTEIEEGTPSINALEAPEAPNEPLPFIPAPASPAT